MLNGGDAMVLYGDKLDSTYENTLLGDGKTGNGAIHHQAGKITDKLVLRGYGVCMAVFDLK